MAARNGLQPEGNQVTALQYLPDKKIVSGDNFGNIFIYEKEGEEWKQEQIFDATRDENVTGIQVTPEGEMIYCGGFKFIETINIFDRDIPNRIGTIQWGFSAMQVLRDGTIVTGDEVGVIRVYEQTAIGRWKQLAAQSKPDVAKTTLDGIMSLQAIDDGRILIGYRSGEISIFTPPSTSSPKPILVKLLSLIYLIQLAVVFIMSK